MKNFYLLMAVVGFAVPNFFALRQSLATGNWLLWRDLAETSSLAFANPVASAFVSDLFILLPVALVWMIVEARRVGVARAWVCVVVTPLFGLSFGLPLFLYLRERTLELATSGAGGSGAGRAVPPAAPRSEGAGDPG